MTSSCSESRNSSVGTVTRLRVGRPRNRNSISNRSKTFFSSPQRPDRSLLYNGYQRALSPPVNRQGRELDHSSTSSADTENARSYTSTLPYVLPSSCCGYNALDLCLGVHSLSFGRNTGCPV
jgi:hypothetical protein